MQGYLPRGFNPHAWTVIDGGKDDWLLELSHFLILNIRDEAAHRKHDAAIRRMQERAHLTVVKVDRR